jgi:two-component sensor histidine kinase
MNEYMETLCRALAEAILEPLGIKCELITQAGIYPAERCERLGLVVAELVTNAAKHAFCGRAGTVRISVREDTKSLICVVSDDGVGMSLGPSGVGSQILEQLVRAIDGTMVVKSGRTGTSVAVSCKSTATY